MKINDLAAVNENEVLFIKHEQYNANILHPENERLVDAVRIKYLDKDRDDDFFDTTLEEIKEFITNMNAYWSRRNN